MNRIYRMMEGAAQAFGRSFFEQDVE